MIKSKDHYLSTTEAAKILGFSDIYVRKLIRLKKLTAEKFGRNWIIEKKNLKKVKRQRFSRKKESVKNGNNE